MKYISRLLLVSMLFTSTLIAEVPVKYSISFENRAHHEATIEAVFSAVSDNILELRMSRSSPGRYALHEFAKNVYELHAFDAEGIELPVTRPNPYQWNVADHKGYVRIVYTLYAGRADGTYSGITNYYAHLNIPATFIWARNNEARPIEVEFKMPESWKVASQLEKVNGSVYSAPNLYYFMDSPTLLADFSMRETTIDGKTFQFAVNHDSKENVIDKLADATWKAVKEQIAIYGELPEFDFGRYIFIGNYNPYVSGDGMEHRNSTMLSRTMTLNDGYKSVLGTVSHEFFHAWNVERIRPRDLEPFDFERANMSASLWFSEGFTSYYGHLALARSGAWSIEQFVASCSGGLNTVLVSPARKIKSADDMSRWAPFNDAAVSKDPMNKENTFISYYTYGKMIALGLDLTLRTQFGKTLDDYMKLIWEAHGKTEIPFTNQDLIYNLGALINDHEFARNYFNKYILGNDVVNYTALLERAGILLNKKNPSQAAIGYAQLSPVDDGLELESNSYRGSPIYNIGIDRGDILTKLNDKDLNKTDDLRKILEDLKPGEQIQVKYIQFGEEITGQITLEEDKNISLILYEDVSMPVTKVIKKFRQSWLGSKANNK